MEYRQLGRSGLKVPVLSFGTATFVANIVIGARDETQLRANLGAVGWALTPDQSARLDAASRAEPISPYWHQLGFASRNPPPTAW